MVTVPCTRNNFMHLTSFFGNFVGQLQHLHQTPTHHWNDRARTLTRTAALKPWSYCVRRRHWKLASHIANLLAHRWVQRIFVWNPSVRYRCVGRRPHTWIIKSKFCVDTMVWGRGWKKQHECHHHWTALFEACHTFCQM